MKRTRLTLWFVRDAVTAFGFFQRFELSHHKRCARRQ